jgi:hypothetical protein
VGALWGLVLLLALPCLDFWWFELQGKWAAVKGGTGDIWGENAKFRGYWHCIKGLGRAFKMTNNGEYRKCFIHENDVLKLISRVSFNLP